MPHHKYQYWLSKIRSGNRMFLAISPNLSTNSKQIYKIVLANCSKYENFARKMLQYSNDHNNNTNNKHYEVKFVEVKRYWGTQGVH